MLPWDYRCRTMHEKEAISSSWDQHLFLPLCASKKGSELPIFLLILYIIIILRKHRCSNLSMRLLQHVVSTTMVNISSGWCVEHVFGSFEKVYLIKKFVCLIIIGCFFRALLNGSGNTQAMVGSGSNFQCIMPNNSPSFVWNTNHFVPLGELVLFGLRRYTDLKKFIYNPK